LLCHSFRCIARRGMHSFEVLGLSRCGQTRTESWSVIYFQADSVVTATDFFFPIAGRITRPGSAVIHTLLLSSEGL
jgi:hypothetical protein